MNSEHRKRGGSEDVSHDLLLTALELSALHP